MFFDRLLDPAILFFLLGMLATVLRSNLEIPQPLPKLFSLYLLFSIGFRGGVELSHSGLTLDMIKTLAAAALFATFVPLYCYKILRLKFDVANSAAIAAAYGSVSAVTFAAAQAFAESRGLQTNGYMVAALAVMESPAILVGLYLAGRHTVDAKRLRIGSLIHEATTNGAVFLLLGSLVIGAIVPTETVASMKPFTADIYKGMLSFFLLDMGIVAASRVRDLAKAGVFLLSFAILLPIFNALLGIACAYTLGFSAGNALLFALLCGSASYIAVPAAMRLALPKANPSYYVSMSLAVTFPFNVLFGIPLYYSLIDRLWGSI
jgi:hypothetical protein